MREILILLIVFNLLSCGNDNLNQPKNIVVSRVDYPTYTNGKYTAKVNDELEIRFDELEQLGERNMYFGLTLYNNGIAIWKDSIQEFEFTDEYPTVRKLPNGSELLILVNDRPYLEKLLQICVSNEKVRKSQLLPAFQMKPVNMDDDIALELFGKLSTYETVGDNMQTAKMPYSPLLAYEFLNSGIELDSILTMKINTEIYGVFLGHRYVDSIDLISVAEYEKKLRELVKQYN